MIYLERTVFCILLCRLVSWSQSCDKTKTLTSKTEGKANTSTFKAKAVKICL